MSQDARQMSGPYPVVNHGHIVPKFWLKQWAVDGLLKRRLLTEDRAQYKSPKKAATRGPMYRRTRPDGTEIDDVEASLARLENAVAPLLKSLESHWPLTLEEKGKLAELFAFQAIRGPRWKDWHSAFAQTRLEELRAERGFVRPSGIWLPVGPQALTELEDKLASDTDWLARMMAMANKLITLFGSMTWDLIEFEDDVVVISDHPVVEWPFGDEMRKPEIPTDHGIANLLECRVPVSPRMAVLMTWADETDGPVRLATHDVAENLNANTIANAEREWMYKPGTSPPISRGPFAAISRAVRPTYRTANAQASFVRAEVMSRMEARMGVDPVDGIAEIVWIGEPSA